MEISQSVQLLVGRRADSCPLSARGSLVRYVVVFLKARSLICRSKSQLKWWFQQLKQKCQILKKWGSRCLGLSGVCGCFSSFCASGLCLKKVSFWLVSVPRDSTPCCKGHSQQGLWGRGMVMVLFGVTGGTSFRASEMLRSRQGVLVACIQLWKQSLEKPALLKGKFRR